MWENSLPASVSPRASVAHVFTQDNAIGTYLKGFSLLQVMFLPFYVKPPALHPGLYHSHPVPLGSDS